MRNKTADFDHYHLKQTGTGPSLRHIEGSKIAKGLQSVEVLSFTVPEKPKSWTELARHGSASGPPAH